MAVAALHSTLARLRREPLSLVFLAALAAYLVGRVVQAMNHSAGDCCYDTFSYSYRGVPEFDRGELVSFVGQAPRLWGAPLLYAAFDTDHQRAMAQWAIGTVAWAVLAWALWSTLRTSAAKVLAAFAVLLLGVQAQVANWDFLIITESLSVSLGVLTVGLLVLWLRGRSRVVLALMTLTAFWWTFVRPEIRVFTVALVACLVWLMIRDRGRVRALLPAALALALAVGWCSAIMPTVSKTFAGWSATRLSLDEETLMFRLRSRIFVEPEYKQVYLDELGMPACAAMDAATGRGRGPISRFSSAYRQCPETMAWGAEHGASSSYRFALSAPDLYLAATVEKLPESLSAATYAEVASVTPDRVNRLVFPSEKRVLPVLGLAALLLLAAAPALGGRRHRLLLGASVLLATAVGSVALGLMYAGSEYGRLGLQEALAVRIALVFLLGVAVDAAIERRRARRSAAATPRPAVMVPAQRAGEPDPVPVAAA